MLSHSVEDHGLASNPRLHQSKAISKRLMLGRQTLDVVGSAVMNTEVHPTVPFEPIMWCLITRVADYRGLSCSTTSSGSDQFQAVHAVYPVTPD